LLVPFLGLAAVGDIVAVGAMFAEGLKTGFSHGEVMIYQKSGTKWSQINKLTGSDVGASDLL
jgi:hypothetical protein